MTYPLTDRDLERLERRVAELEREASRHPVRQVAAQPFAARGARLVQMRDPIYSEHDGNMVVAARTLEDGTLAGDGEEDIDVCVSDLSAPQFGFCFKDGLLWVTRWVDDQYRPVSPGYQTIGVKPVAALISGTSGDCEVLDGLEEIGVQLEVMHEGLALGEIEAGTHCYATWMAERWTITAVACAPPE